ncbi:NAD-dependent epimerase/dehydratase family protein [Microbacter sp. ANSKLAB05]|nr:NAD-dependent epimerase/dehydratase family protein [Microbacter sp. ANSKLAB05]
MPAIKWSPMIGGNVEPGRRARGHSHYRISPWLLVDAAMLSVLATAALFLLFDFEVARTIGHVPGVPLSVIVAGMILLMWALGLASGLYRGRFAPGSAHEITALLAVFVGSSLVGFIVLVLVGATPNVPESLPLVTGAFTATAALIARFVVRRNELFGAGAKRTGIPAIVFGAGSGGSWLVSLLRRSSASPYVPVAILDDDRSKFGMLVDGVKVVGGRLQLRAVAEKFSATSLLIAAPSIPADDLKEIQDEAAALGLEVVVMPTIGSIMRNRSDSGELTRIDVDDLLGRTPAHLNSTQIADSIRGKKVLITGAGGSIGSELARQIYRFRPSNLTLLDRDESGLHSVKLTLDRQAMLDGEDTLLLSIRDFTALLGAMTAHAPDIVFHAAALKHLPLLERYPLEALKTNVLGTHNVLRAAAIAGVTTVVNISTDKAANPSSVLGASKRVAERITAAVARDHPDRCMVSVRFGNVLGSRGSVLTTFEHQILAGGPITVTDPDVARYFMTIQEACKLVLQAAAIGRNGETLVLDMGDPIKIADVANSLIAQSGRTDIEIVYTGLRKGEKLVEELLDHTESPVSGERHDAISVVTVPPLDTDPEEVLSISEPETARQWITRHAYE